MKMGRLQIIIFVIVLSPASLMVRGQSISFTTCTTNSDCSPPNDRCLPLLIFPGLSVCVPDRGSICGAPEECATTDTTCAGPPESITVCGGCATSMDCMTNLPATPICFLSETGFFEAIGFCVECQTDGDCTAPASFCDSDQEGTTAIPSQPFFSMTCRQKMGNGLPCRRDEECLFPGVTCSTTTHTCAGDTLPNLRVDGALCNADTECRSGICRGFIRKVCGLKLDGSNCQVDAECQRNNCTGNICVSPGKADGAICFRGSECSSKLCLFRSNRGVRLCGPLPLRPNGARCNLGRECTSGRCSGGFFRRVCAAKVAENGQCRRTPDCQPPLTCQKIQGLGANLCLPPETTTTATTTAAATTTTTAASGTTAAGTTANATAGTTAAATTTIAA